MDKQQVEWAKQHDWFIGSYRDSCSGALVVQARGDAGEPAVCIFHSFKQLKAWAGY